MTTRVTGHMDPRLSRDEKGYRTYKLTYLIESDDPADGPLTVLRTPGIALPGAPWIIGNDIDPWVWARPDAEVKGEMQEENTRVFKVEQTFSNKPSDDSDGSGGTSQCHEQEIEDPLMQPDTIGGNSENIMVEGLVDRHGTPIRYSSFEAIRGPLNEWEKATHTIKIGQNRGTLGIANWAWMLNYVNSDDMWGFPPGWVRFTGSSWQRRFWGQCLTYWHREFEFKILPGGWDRCIPDIGSRVLRGYWQAGRWVLRQIDGADPDPTNPAHFIRFQDVDGHYGTTLLADRGGTHRGRPFVPEEPEEEKWWCLWDSTNSFVVKATCSSALWILALQGADSTHTLHGPYETQVLAETTCDPTAPRPPNPVTTCGQPNTPGKICIEFYRRGVRVPVGDVGIPNRYTFATLGLPTVIGP